jgi:hypothetical protein
MTSTVNGIGTKLFGSRRLTQSEYIEHQDQLPYSYDDVIYKIATEGFTFLWIPIIPTETIIYVDVKSVKEEGNRTHVLDSDVLYETVSLGKFKFNNNKTGVRDTSKYQVCSTYHVNWHHVKSCIGFYFSPITLPILIVYDIFDLIRNVISKKHADES